MIIIDVILIVSAYLIGSIPFGYIYTKKLGKDITQLGSKNIGSTNVRRVAGKKYSLYTQISDMLKGIIPVGIAILFNHNSFLYFNSITVLFIAFFSVMGHCFSIFLKFRGGKGVNTFMGASLFLSPISIIVAGFCFLILKKILKYTSLSSLITLALVISLHGVCKGVNLIFYYFVIVIFIIFLLHLKNIMRLLNKKENL